MKQFGFSSRADTAQLMRAPPNANLWTIFINMFNIYISNQHRFPSTGPHKNITSTFYLMPPGIIKQLFPSSQYKQKIMQQKDQQGEDFAQEDEDEVISKIKTIASEIFTSFSDNESIDRKVDEEDLNAFGFEKGFGFQAPKADADRKYSYTERCYKRSQQEQESKAGRKVGGKVVQEKQKFAQNQQRENRKEKKNAKIQQKDGKIKQNPQNFKKKILDKKIPDKNSPQTHKNSIKQNNYDTQTDRKVSEVASPPPLVSSRFMDPIGNFKQSLISDIYQKTLKEQLEYKQSMAKKKSLLSLEELYKEKQPLYDRFIRDQYKKKMKMQESRISAFQKQLQDFVGTPSINTNIQIKGSFEERSKKNNKKREEHKQKILYDSMKDSTFTPKTSSPKRYKNIGSKVREIWKPNTQVRFEDEQYSSQNLGDGMDLKGISQQLLRTGSFFSDESQNSPNKNKSFDLKIRSVQQLSHILELDDLNEE